MNLSREYFSGLVPEQQFDKLIEELFQFPGSFPLTEKNTVVSEPYDSLVVIADNYEVIEQEKLPGISNSESFFIQLNKIGDSLTKLINSIPDAILYDHSNRINVNEPIREKIKKFQSSSAFTYDIFLSFSNRDINKAQKIIGRLRG
jgi:hypothetical protein